MKDIFAPLTPADYSFVVGLVNSYTNLTDDQKLRGLLDAVVEDDSTENRDALDRQLEREIRYLGSSDIAYVTRYFVGKEAGVSVHEITRDVAKALKIRLPSLGTDRERAEFVVEQYVTDQFSGLSSVEQQKMLEDLGVERDKAAAFIKRSAGVFALPMLIQAFNIIIVEGLIKRIIFGAIAGIIGSQLAGRLFQFVAGRFPWWLGWIGPVAWTASIGWTVVDIQGPAMRKTIPLVLYLGLCGVRERMATAP